VAIDVPTFKAAFPEFVDAPDDLVQAQLDFATARATPSVWGGLTEEGAFVYCARFLALSPYSRHMGLVNEKGGTNYDERLNQLLLTVTSGYRTTL